MTAQYNGAPKVQFRQGNNPDQSLDTLTINVAPGPTLSQINLALGPSWNLCSPNMTVPFNERNATAPAMLQQNPKGRVSLPNSTPEGFLAHAIEPYKGYGLGGLGSPPQSNQTYPPCGKRGKRWSSLGASDAQCSRGSMSLESAPSFDLPSDRTSTPNRQNNQTYNPGNCGRTYSQADSSGYCLDSEGSVAAGVGTYSLSPQGNQTFAAPPRRRLSFGTTDTQSSKGSSPMSESMESAPSFNLGMERISTPKEISYGQPYTGDDSELRYMLDSKGPVDAEGNSESRYIQCDHSWFNDGSSNSYDNSKYLQAQSSQQSSYLPGSGTVSRSPPYFASTFNQNENLAGTFNNEIRNLENLETQSLMENIKDYQKKRRNSLSFRNTI